MDVSTLVPFVSGRVNRKLHKQTFVNGMSYLSCYWLFTLLQCKTKLSRSYKTQLVDDCKGAILPNMLGTFIIHKLEIPSSHNEFVEYCWVSNICLTLLICGLHIHMVNLCISIDNGTIAMFMLFLRMQYWPHDITVPSRRIQIAGSLKDSKDMAPNTRTATA
jgi:hypothetical protein